MANTETTINAVVNPQNNDAPIDIEKTIKALERNKFVAHYFETAAEAVAYLKNRIQNKCVAIGDSRTLLEIGVHDALSEVNEDITDIQRPPLPGESFRDTALRTMGRDVFLTSVNALSQTGEMVNIDGTGNRVAASLFGSQEVFFVLGINKITPPDLASAIYRARNVAAPPSIVNSTKRVRSTLALH
nr:lactate utilization protein [Veillonella rogosae]